MATGRSKIRGKIGGYPAQIAARRSTARTPSRPHAGPVGLPSGVDTGPTLQSLRKSEPRSLADLVERMRSDYQVHFAETTLRANVESVPVTVSTDSNDPRAVAFCEAMQATWGRTLAAMCDAIGHGRVAFEKRWTFDPANGINHLESLDALPFKATSMVLRGGHFCGIKLAGRTDSIEAITNGENEIVIPPESSWWLSLDATVVEPHGRSRFLGAPRAEWESRRETFELRLKYLRKFMLRGGVIRGPAQVQDPRTGEFVDAAAAMSKGMDDLRSGGFLYLPDARDKNGNYLYDVAEPPKLSDPTPIEVALDRSDVRMLRSFGISELAVQQTGDLGSFAMAVMHRLILNAVVGGIVSQFAESFDHYCVRKGALLNWFADELPEISVTFPDMTAVPDSLMVEVAKAVITSPVIPPGAALLNLRSIFEVSGIPITDDFDARLQKALATAAATLPGTSLPGGPGGPDSDPRNPQRNPLGLANEVDVPPIDVPTADRLLADASQRLAGLHGRLFDLSTQLRDTGPFSRDRIEREISATVREIQKFAADTRLAARVLGMLSPWVKSINESWERAGRQKPVTMSTLADDYEWPFLNAAVEFLINRNAVTTAQFNALSDDDRRAALEIPEIDDVAMLNGIRNEIARSIEEGESLESFRERMQQRIGLAESQVSTMFRTTTHQAYVAGQEQSLSSPAVAGEFPFVMYASTTDTRTRPAHAAVDGFVVRRGSREHQVLLKLLGEYNCRCTLIPLSEADARGYGIKTYADLPDVVLHAVGLVSGITFANSTFDESKVKRDGGKFAKVAGKKKSPLAKSTARAIGPAKYADRSKHKPAAGPVVNKRYVAESKYQWDHSKSGDRAGTIKAIAAIGMRESDLGRLAAASGAIPGSKVTVQQSGFKSVSIRTVGPNGEYDLARSLERDADGKLVMRNINFWSDKTKRGGLGTSVFATQVKHAAQLGVSKITCLAARGDSERQANGYYTWPRLGYDAKLDNGISTENAVKLRRKYAKATTVSEVMRTKQGRDDWKRLGYDVESSFDMTRGSKSMKILGAYFAELAKAGRKPKTFSNDNSNGNEGDSGHGGMVDLDRDGADLTPEQEAALERAWEGIEAGVDYPDFLDITTNEE